MRLEIGVARMVHFLDPLLFGRVRMLRFMAPLDSFNVLLLSL